VPSWGPQVPHGLQEEKGMALFIFLQQATLEPVFLFFFSTSKGDLFLHLKNSTHPVTARPQQEELGKRLYHLYNKEIFEESLPADMEITWNVR
jgi:hypothetical protein